MNTYAPWFMDPVKKRHPIAPVQPGALRGKIVALPHETSREQPLS